MKKLLTLILLAASACLAGPTIVPGSVTVNEIGYSSGLVHFSTTANWTGVRIRYVDHSLGSCTDGVSGDVVPTQYPGYSTYRSNTLMQVIVQGLPLADHDWSICPEVSDDNGRSANTWSGTWSGGVEYVMHTKPFNEADLYPIPPTEYHPVYPDTTSYHVLTTDNSCNITGTGQGLGDAMSDAVHHNTEYGTVIKIPRTAVCDQLAQINGDSENVVYWDATALAAGDPASGGSTITLTDGQLAQLLSGNDNVTALTEGMKVRFAAKYNSLPGGRSNNYPTEDDPRACTGILFSKPYYIHLPNPANQHTFQLACGGVYGGTDVEGDAVKLMNFKWLPGGGNLKIQRDPTGNYWTILTNDVDDAHFAPQNTRVGPTWFAKMPKFTMGLKGQTGVYSWYNHGNVPVSDGIPAVQFKTSSEDGNNLDMISNVWLRGLEFTIKNDIDSQTSTDPRPFQFLISSIDTSSNIVFDRLYIHGLGAPHRIYRPVGSFDGHNMAFINSYTDRLDLFQSNMHGFNPTQTSSTSFTISAGRHGINGLHKFITTSDATVSLATNGVTGDAFIYTPIDGHAMQIALPPGVTGTCTGVPCEVSTTAAVGNGLFANGDAYPNSQGGKSIYWVDPIFSASSDGSNPVSLLQGVEDPSMQDETAGPTFYPNPVTLASHFRTRAAGFITAVRFYKPSQDTGTSHTVKVWDMSSNVLATGTVSGETVSGWQTATLSSPLAVTNGGEYIASYYSPIGGMYADNFWQNRVLISGALEGIGGYQADTGSCDVNHAFPRNWVNNISVGIIGCLHIDTGSITSISRGNARSSNFAYSWASGCNCVIAGHGPGPFNISNNYFEATGLPFHFDEGGIDSPVDRHGAPKWWRGDYLIYRNEFKVPLQHMDPQPPSTYPERNVDYDADYDANLWNYAMTYGDGLYYQGRQPFEFKGGKRAKVVGNRFNQTYNNTASSIFFTMTSVCDESITDILVKSNLFQHGTGGMVGISSTQGGCMPTAPPRRLQVTNNVGWDIRRGYFAPGDAQNSGTAWFMENIPPESVVVEHNTWIYNPGRAAAFIYLFGPKSVGVRIRHNIFWSWSDAGARSGIGVQYDPLLSGPDSCGTLANGSAYAACALPGADISDNVIFSDYNNTQLQGIWSDGKNILPSDPTNVAAGKWTNIANAVSWLASPLASMPDFNLLHTSDYINGGAKAPSDGKSQGADMIQFQVDQGNVRLNPTSAIGTTTATINFLAPDSDACRVDYSSTDATVSDDSFLHTDDTSVGRSHHVTLSGLTADTTYHYRVNCMVEQPMGVFKTKP